MAEVWRGVHRQSGVPVAVKILSGEQYRDPFLLECFRTEARAVAQLHHSSIILLYDYGEVPFETSQASGGTIKAGHPYLVMELATGGTLAHQPPRSWPELMTILSRLLDALAHAHARGVIHRDIKPSNVLVSAPGDVRPGLKLTDFGSATAGRPELASRDEESLVGTASYMPPEQIRGKIRDSGPWTDLYSIGVLGWVLASGHPPFRHDDLHELFRMHLRADLPDLLPRFPVPDGFEGWLQAMLAKDIGGRYRRAADAAWALEQVAAAEDIFISPRDSATSLPTRTLPSDAFQTLTINDESTLIVTGGFSAIDLEAAEGQSLAPLETPFPNSWARSEPPPLNQLLAGAGLGVYSLRSPPLVGRFAERDAAWEVLRTVVAGEGCQMVLFEADSGLGVSRLGRWIAERAHELGAATVLSAEHSPIPSAMDPLRRLLEKYFSSRGLSRSQTRRRVGDRLRWLGIDDAYEAAALTELLLAGGDGEEDEEDESKHEGARIRLSGLKQRYGLIARVVHAHSRKRPVILFLDDLQWGGDAINFAQHLLTLENDPDDPVRVLIIGTLRSDHQDESRRESAALRDLESLSSYRKFRLGRLSQGEMLTLVDELLGLSTELARQVAARADGNPTFAIQLVGSWVEGGLLSATDRGFELTSATSTGVPDNIHQLWLGVLGRVLNPFGMSGLLAVEVAAVLGRQVDQGEWEELAKRTGRTIPEGLLDALANRGLIRQGAATWSFTHALLRESIEQLAQEEGRLAKLHQACVDMLLSQGAGPMRLGRHMVLAGTPGDALGPLLNGADIAWSKGEYGRVAEFLSIREQALEASGVPRANPAWGQGWLRRARLAMRHGDHDLGSSLLKQTEERARENDWPAELAEALASRSAHESFLGRHSLARQTAEESVALAEASGDLVLVARSYRALGQRLMEQGELSRADEVVRRSREIFEAFGDEVGIIQSEQVLFNIARQRGDLDEARRIIHGLVSLQEKRGYRWGLASAVNGLGDIARTEAKLDKAEAHYRRAASLFESVSHSSSQARSIGIKLALVLIAQERYEEAESLLADVKIVVDKTGSALARGFARLLLSCCAAGQGNWATFDTPFLKGLSLLSQADVHHVDVAVTAERIGRLALRKGQGDRAYRALLLAQRQWGGLGRKAEETRVGALLDQISSEPLGS